LLDWRLAADCLEILRFGQPLIERWAETRVQAVEAAVTAFPGWSCRDPFAAEPLIEGTHDRPIRVVHPLANIDNQLAAPPRPSSLRTSSTSTADRGQSI
jgi:hypothetical protein